MKINTLVAIAWLIAMTASVAVAEVQIDGYVMQTDSGPVTYTVDVGGDFSFTVSDNVDALIGGAFTVTDLNANTVELTEFYVGAQFNDNFYFTVGKQSDLWVSGTARKVSGNTLASPVSGDYSVIAGMNFGAVAVGYDNATSDVSNVQVAAYFQPNVAWASDVTFAIDWNKVTNDMAYAMGITGEMGAVTTSVVMTYDTEFAYEIGAGVSGVSVFVAGTGTNVISQVGGGYTYALNGADLWVEGMYDVDTQGHEVAAGVSLSF